MCKRKTASRAVRVAQGNSTTLHCVARTPVHHPFSHQADQQMSLLARQPSSLTAALDVAMALGALCPGTASPRLIVHGHVPSPPSASSPSPAVPGPPPPPVLTWLALSPSVRSLAAPRAVPAKHMTAPPLPAPLPLSICRQYYPNTRLVCA